VDLDAAANSLLAAFDLCDRLLNQQHAGKAMGQSIPCCPAHAKLGEAEEAAKSIITEVRRLRASTPYTPAAHPSDHEFVPDADCASDCGKCGWEGP
jgi:hypothetical protein